MRVSDSSRTSVASVVNPRPRYNCVQRTRSGVSGDDELTRDNSLLYQPERRTPAEKGGPACFRAEGGGEQASCDRETCGLSPPRPATPRRARPARYGLDL